MLKASLLIDALKRELEARSITYADLAARIDISEASVKRMFAQKNFTLQRLDEILQATEISLRDLALASNEEPLISELTFDQEKEIISDPKKFIVAVSALNLLTVEQMTRIYDISEIEVVKHLLRLDKIGFLELLPNNRVKLLVARTFRWIPNGPIQSNFRDQAYAEYLESNFDGEHEIMRLVNVMLSKQSVAALLNRLKQVAREFSEQHQEDAKLPFEEKHRISFMLAARPWLPKQFKSLVRKDYIEQHEQKKNKKSR
ncbi:helix-turn-helix transcriptional regulator [Undibacterium sp. 5I1]|uniref:helix-turn-helix domain-containing protein n=1 Tax=unclassified Undibacterium TaxID=2630295 RepID=UPI002AB48068|nr:MULTISPECIES: helix-turn-helix transcriptional regulator [unclassified Undibacterium]MDY7536706.1 helix-turn-helix transcriptional regulator [Undibacterium sp. 5I1]MEB0230249.1 helix-turn-helix transcriptional regulator [Undibacterium sp. 10I3]MEB0257949.1 helix-turn-helix transcriptional regulator [Undibacterium sp. 5I1]